jgi:predicted NBD/HSP70 family sugar kinase
VVSHDLKTSAGWLKDSASPSPAPLSSPVVRRANASTVLKVLQKLGTASRVDLARATGLTSTTAYRLVDHLSNLDLIAPAEVEQAREGAGRRPSWYQFNSRVASIAAVDVGNETTRIALGDATGTVVAGNEAATVSLSANLVANIVQRVRALVDEALHAGPLAGISVGIAAIVDQDSGIVVKASQHSEWDGLPLRDELSRFLGCPATVAQDDHLAALAEFSNLSTARGNETVVVVNQGKGVGAGFILGGRPYAGAHGAAGRLEAWLLPGESQSTAVGQVLTADALVAAYRERGGTRALTDGKSLCMAAVAGDAVAVGVVNELAVRLGRIFLQLAVAFDPDVMIFGGGFAGSHELFEPEIRRSLALRPRPPEFRISQLGEQAVVLGAMQRSLEHVDRRILDILESA